ncbi:CMTM3, partial [Cervus elaphus hippelaphus]
HAQRHWGSTVWVLILRLQNWAGHSLLEPPPFLPAGWGCAQPLTSPSLASQGLSFIIFVCYVASSASAFLTAPLLEFLLALCFLFADAMQLNDKWQGLCWPMMDFLRCVTAALIYFAISITAVAKYPDGASKAAGVFGFFATIVFAIDFYLIFNDVAKFLKQGDSAHETTADKAEEENSDSDSD